MRALSKSKILAFRQCPKRLWLEIHQPELGEDSSSTQASFKTGNQVGEIACRIYDPKNKGELLNPFKDGFEEAFTRTSELLKSSKPIFEAAFTAKGALSLADVMLPVTRKKQRQWQMIEVKSSTSVKDYYRDDVAIQTYIMQNADVPLNKVSLAFIDTSWIYPGGGDYTGLLIEENLTKEAFARTEEVASWIKSAATVVAKKSEPKMSTGDHCSSPYACSFIDYCRQDEKPAEYPVTWLPRIQSKALKAAIFDESISDMRDVPDDLLNAKQQRVKQHTLSGKVFFNAAGAKSDLADYKLPAYFLDFESINFAVPIWKGMRPYQQVAFQYSLHKLTRNGTLEHREFLDLSAADPSKSLATQLVNQCGKQGPVYVYFAGFEKTRIKELAAKFPKLKQSLLAINDRVVDLLPIAQERYYNPSQHGSWSIKKVLPAIAPDLNYSELDGVQDGGMAMDAFSEAIDKETSSERKQEIEYQLKKYCELDTFAMVRLWEFFSGKKTKTQQKV
jgi:hypothetical protein